MSTDINSTYIPPPNNEVWISSNDVTSGAIVTSSDTYRNVKDYPGHFTNQYLEDRYRTTLAEVIDLIKTAYPERLL